jgi:Exopolyphosphatase
MLYAIVDLGSNTIRLCIYEYSDHTISLLFEKKTMAGLMNFVNNQHLSKEGMDKACSVLEEYKIILRDFHVEEGNIHVFATASSRNISNTDEAVTYLSETTGLQIDLLSGEEEAKLDFAGAIRSMNLQDGILVDIGGGSTEIVVFHDKTIQFAASMPIGSLNLYLNFVEKLIPKKEERKEIKKEVLDYLELLNLEPVTYKSICGIGGTVRAASKLNNSIYNLPSTNKVIEAFHIKEMLKTIKNSRQQTLTPVLRNIPDRIHTIIPGMIILNTIAEYFCCDDILVSQYGIREGYLYEKVLAKDET